MWRVWPSGLSVGPVEHAGREPVHQWHAAAQPVAARRRTAPPRRSTPAATTRADVSLTGSGNENSRRTLRHAAQRLPSKSRLVYSGFSRPGSRRPSVVTIAVRDDPAQRRPRALVGPRHRRRRERRRAWCRWSRATATGSAASGSPIAAVKIGPLLAVGTVHELEGLPAAVHAGGAHADAAPARHRPTSCSPSPTASTSPRCRAGTAA